MFVSMGIDELRWKNATDRLNTLIKRIQHNLEKKHLTTQIRV